MITVAFNKSPFDAINTTYPNKYKEWEFNIVPRDYWENKDNRIKAIKWLIEEKLKLSDEEIKKQLSNKLFKDNGLLTMIKSYYDASPYKVINTLYPGRFKEWEFNQVPRGYWSNKENGIKATKWLIEEKLKLRDEDLKQQLSQKLFVDNGLGGMLSLCFNNSPYQAINTTYPNKYKKCDFKGYRIEP